MALIAGLRWSLVGGRQPTANLLALAAKGRGTPASENLPSSCCYSNTAEALEAPSMGGASQGTVVARLCGGLPQLGGAAWYSTHRGIQQHCKQSSLALKRPFGVTRSFAAAGAPERVSDDIGEDLQGNDNSVNQDPVMTAHEYRQHHRIKVSAADPPDPFVTFEQCGFPAAIMKSVNAAGYKEPSIIQAQAWPVAMTGRDLVAVASTGSGKTAGYLLPALLHIRSMQKDVRQGPAVLIVAPTRELAKQIDDEAAKFGSHLGLRTACLYGGSPRAGQVRKLLRSPHIVIGCPGRLLDFAGTGELNLSQASYLVLDEADRMLDMGFEKDLQSLAALLPMERQTLFFSATWPREVQNAADGFARNEPVHVFIGDSQDKMVAAKTIHQKVELVESPQEKMQRLMDYISAQPQGSRIIIFCSTKNGCDWLTHQIRTNGGPRAAAIHGDKGQRDREFAIQNFKSGRCPVLVATDVAARGLDIEGVQCVVNYDFPGEIEMYVHRIGRTGRAGAQGEALTFFSPTDNWAARDLIQVMQDAGQEAPQELIAIAQRSGRGKKPAYNKGRGNWSRDGNDRWRSPYGRDRGGFRDHRDTNQEDSFFRAGSAGRDEDSGDYRPRGRDSREQYGRTRLDGSRWGR